MKEQRCLAAILVADVVGYSRLGGQDEGGTLARLSALSREVIEPVIARHASRLFKEVGDGFLVEFSSAVQAVTAALEIQKAAGPDSLPLRIGIHVGDVVIRGGDLMGDGVNIAARIVGTIHRLGAALAAELVWRYYEADGPWRSCCRGQRSRPLGLTASRRSPRICPLPCASARLERRDRCGTPRRISPGPNRRRLAPPGR